MPWAVLIVRIIVGGGFIVFGLDHWLHYMPKPPEPPESARHFIGAIYATPYFDVVKGLEVIGGLLVLTGRFAPLGLVLLVPVTVNIALWDAFLVKYTMPPIGTVMLVLEIFLLFAYRRYFASVFTSDARPG